MGRYYTPAQLSAIENVLRANTKDDADTFERQFQVFREKDDPVLWGEGHLFDPDSGETPLKVKGMFGDFLRCSKKNRALRVGRQVGKTVHTCLDILHTAKFNKGAVIVVLVTEKKLMNRMLEIIDNFLRKSDLRTTFWKNTASNKKSRGGVSDEEGNDLSPKYDYEYVVGDGFSHIRFFFTGNNPDKVRGQRATHIYIDETEYHPEKLQPVVTGILKGNPAIKLSCLSTPAGLIGSWFYNFCMTCADPEDIYGEEFHLTPEMDPNWPELEPILRSVIFDDVTWDLEVKAEFRNAVGSVYKADLVDAAVARSNRGEVYISAEAIRATLEYRKARKILGVDWNTPQNGVRLVEVMETPDGPWITRNEIISFNKYTQKIAVERIIELFDENRYSKIVVDAGHGEAQIESLDIHLSSRVKDVTSILMTVNSVAKEEVVLNYRNTITGRSAERILKIPVSERLVDIVSKYLERGLMIPKEEDRPNRLVAEMRNLRRKNSENMKRFTYEGGGHSLSALQLALYGYDTLIKDDAKGSEDILLLGVPSNAGLSLTDAAKKHRTEIAKNGICSSPFIGSTRTPGKRTATLYGGQGRSSISSRYPNPNKD